MLLFCIPTYFRNSSSKNSIQFAIFHAIITYYIKLCHFINGIDEKLSRISRFSVLQILWDRPIKINDCRRVQKQPCHYARRVCIVVFGWRLVNRRLHCRRRFFFFYLRRGRRRVVRLYFIIIISKLKRSPTFR